MTDYSVRIDEIIKSLKTDLKELTLKIHDNPELGRQEVKACRWQTELLKKYGFETEAPFAGFETAYKAVYRGKKDGPNIAMLAEYDALPALGHGCGHNLIAMISVGAGIAMREFADELGANIYVIGTPAEETDGLKVPMANAGVFDDMDVAMMSHPAAVYIDSANTMAIHSYKISFRGKTAHAAAAPEEGLNALDAMINLFNMVNAMRQQTKPDVRIHGIITNGGVAPNIIPDYTECIFYVRANKCSDVEELSKRVENCAKGAAIGAGVEYEMVPVEGQFKDTRSNVYLAHLYAEQMEKQGIPVMRISDQYMSGSSDLGDVSYRCPAIQSGFDISGGKGYGPHTVEFAQCAGSEAGIEAAFPVIKAFVMTAVELLTEPSHLKAIQEEFEMING